VPDESGVTGKRGKTPSEDPHMPEPVRIEAERGVQRSFRKTLWVQQVMLALTLLIFHLWASRQPNRVELGPGRAHLNFTPISFDSHLFAPLRFSGAWKLTSKDVRFGGISALAIEGNAFVALSDSGAVVRFAKPGGGRAADIAELPDGPADNRFKSHRDSEALTRDPLGRGWLVAFENRNEVWLYDRAFERGLGRIAFGRRHWPRNRGIEGLATEGREILLFPESGDSIVRVSGAVAETLPLTGARGRISDAARLPDGRLIVVNRNLTLFGFENRLTLIVRGPDGFRPGESIRLGVSPIDNVEAVASERLSDGTIRLWMMTDDNFQRPMRTLLLALDLPPKRRAVRQPF